MLLTYGLKRQQKIAEWEMRIKMLYKRYPRLEEISRLFSQIALELALLEIGRGKMGMSREELLEAQQSLQFEKKTILKENNLPENIYDVWWDCDKCQDTGFIRLGVKCSCLKKGEISARWQASGLSPQQQSQTFETFSLEWYEERERYQEIFNTCYTFAKNVGEKKPVENLLLHGPVGIGKTHLCSAIANSVLDCGIDVIYLKVGKLLDLIRVYKFNQDAKERVQGNIYLDALFQVRLLIIDDLGTENLTEFAQEQLLTIIDERINYHLPFVISTNLSPNELDSHYELRLIDRLMGSTKVLKFTGDSVRRLLKLGKCPPD